MKTLVDENKIVCDNGTGYLKMGFAGDSFPRYNVPTIVGRPMLRSNQSIGDVELRDIMFGDEASPYRALLDITYPVAHGKVDNWDDFMQLWEYTFTKKMGIKDFTGKRILVTEAALNPRKNREKMAELIFEHFNFSHCIFESQAVLSLMCEGHSTGIVFDSGDGVSHVIPVVDGYIMDHAVTRLNLAGRDVTKYLNKLL
jgi:actin-related protein 2